MIEPVWVVVVCAVVVCEVVVANVVVGWIVVIVGNVVVGFVSVFRVSVLGSVMTPIVPVVPGPVVTIGFWAVSSSLDAATAARAPASATMRSAARASQSQTGDSRDQSSRR